MDEGRAENLSSIHPYKYTTCKMQIFYRNFNQLYKLYLKNTLFFSYPSTLLDIGNTCVKIGLHRGAILDLG